MSQIKLLHSGGNGVILSAPNSNPSSDINLKLPQADGSSGQFLKTDGSGNLSFAAGGGITEADEWRITSDYTGTSAFLTANWSRVSGNFDKIGTGMSQSSGLFAFPSTGIWLVSFQCLAYSYDTTYNYIGGSIRDTTDNGSNFGTGAEQFGFMVSGGNRYHSTFMQFMFDVTDVSTHKVKFYVESASSVRWLSSGGKNFTYATFIRLGDT
tara:strand:+ start:782 stop:1411 length:630 start_codon:yes stop_codon:yes gene_type:complete